MSRAAAIDVFAYRDYRAFLHDYYQHRKAVSSAFSYRSFARRAGVRSPNYLKLVIDGKRNLSTEMAPRFAEACGLDGEPKGYFCELVHFNSTTGEEQARCYQRLAGYHEYQKAHRLEVTHAAYVSAWYVPAIRELALHKDFRPDPRWIAETLRPRIKVSEAKRALAILTELGFLVEADGTLRQRDAVVSTGPAASVHFRRYHQEVIARAAESMSVIPAAERDLSALTVAVSRRGQEEIKARIQRLRKEILALADTEAAPDRVLQVSFQMFPLAGGQS